MAEADHPDAPFVIRVKARREGKITIEDAVQGEVSWEYATLDDMILLRSDGTPTYMHAVVVDDHDMGVTHIIRGDDHCVNVAVYLLADPADRRTHRFLFSRTEVHRLNRHGITTC